MSISQTDAAEALELVGKAQARSALLRGYQSSGPHLILWGAVYAAAYGAGYFAPERAGDAWLVGVPLGIVGDVVIASRDRGDGDWRVIAALAVTFLVLINATAAIMQPHDPRQMAAFVPLLVAGCYVVMGLAMGNGMRLIATGIALAVLTLIGFFAFPALFFLWMAAFGGGALMLGGFWMMRV